MTTARGPRGFPVAITGTDVILSRDYFVGGVTTRWHKPPVDDPARACVFVRVRAAGGGGGGGYNGVSHGGGGGGGGGGYSEESIPYIDCPTLLTIMSGSEGQGGAFATVDDGTDGGDATVTGEGVFVGATGGKGGLAGAVSPGSASAGGAGGMPMVASGKTCSIPGWNGGDGGQGYNTGGAASDGGNSFCGGGGGGGGAQSGQPNGAGGVSGRSIGVATNAGGTGGEGSPDPDATAGTVFGGGGGGGGANQDGADGAPALVEILILREWNSSVFSDRFEG